ncbi:MAG: hypothetical protein ACLR9W_06570 [Enterobacter hormaechei]
MVERQDERSQHKNKAKALSGWAPYHAAEMAKRQQAEALPAVTVGQCDRSDRNRTYNTRRFTDHRINLTLYV